MPRPSSPRSAVADASLPPFVRDEFDAFLECGVLAHGFVRLRCADDLSQTQVTLSLPTD